jgi:hypothetical protein
MLSDFRSQKSEVTGLLGTEPKRLVNIRFPSQIRCKQVCGNNCGSCRRWLNKRATLDFAKLLEVLNHSVGNSHTVVAVGSGYICISAGGAVYLLKLAKFINSMQ